MLKVHDPLISVRRNEIIISSFDFYLTQAYYSLNDEKIIFNAVVHTCSTALKIKQPLN